MLNWTLRIGVFMLQCWMVLSTAIVTEGFIALRLTGETAYAWYYDIPLIMFYSWVLWGLSDGKSKD